MLVEYNDVYFSAVGDTIKVSLEDKVFSKGSVEILKTLAEHKGFVLLGGGNLNDALDRYKISKNKFGYVSLAGGALTAYLAGEKLTGLEALKKGKKDKPKIFKL